MMGLGEQPRMDSIIFGDNQFFGINHMSEEKAQAQAERFRDTRAILDVIDDAYECGLRGFMFNTHAMVRIGVQEDGVDDLRLRAVLSRALPHSHPNGQAGALASLPAFK